MWEGILGLSSKGWARGLLEGLVAPGTSPGTGPLPVGTSEVWQEFQPPPNVSRDFSQLEVGQGNSQSWDLSMNFNSCCSELPS